jgi:hypothetical protein
MQTDKGNNNKADPTEVEGGKTFPGPPDEKHLVKPDGDMRLSKCTLREALDSAYGTLVAHFLGRGHRTQEYCPKFLIHRGQRKNVYLQKN